MSKFNNAIKNYIEEQNIVFNPNAASAATIPPNQQLKNAGNVMDEISNLLQGQKSQTPEEFEKALVSAFTPFGVKTPEEAYKVLEKFGFKKQDQTQQSEQPEQQDLNKTSTQQNNTQPVNQQQNQTKSQSNTYTASAPKA
jgi:hypothetical protein